MTKKSILNTTSKKHQDTMLCYSNTIASAPVNYSTYTANDAVLAGGSGAYIFGWIASARPGLSEQDQKTPGYAIDNAIRQSTVCYMRGLKERVEWQTNSGAAWQWRRICFTLKGDILWQNDANAQRWSLLTSQGMVRVVNNMNGNASGNALVENLFKGRQSVDWNNFMTAPVDRNRCNIKYDKVRTMQSSNEHGFLRRVKLWHPMNSNLHFADDENGNIEDQGRYSVSGRAGMGDYYVVDIVASALGSTSSDQCVWGPNATLYWHEK